MTHRELSLAVVGADHPNKRGPTRRFEIAICKPGEPVELVLEPTNPKDRNAVAVYSERGVQIGYVRAERAPWIGGMIRDGTEIIAIFQGATDYGAAIRIGIGGEPSLPDVELKSGRAEPHDPVNQTPDRDFWPDEEWPDT